MINGDQADPLSLMLLAAEEIETLHIFSPGESDEYGDRAAKFGMVEIWLKKDVKIAGIKELVKLYHIRLNSVQLPVILSFGLHNERLYVKHPGLLLASESKVQQVGVRREYSEEGADLWIVRRMDFGDKNESSFRDRLDSLNNIFREEAKRRYPTPDTILIR